MFAYVTKKASKTGGNFTTLCVDISKAFYLDREERENSFIKLYCYHYENLSTTVREYKTLKMSEFYKMAPLILNPTTALDHKDEMLAAHRKELLKARIIKEEERKNANVMIHAKNIVHVDDQQTLMRKYAKRNRKLFNPSQLIVLDKVIDMPESDILLI